LSGRGQRRPDSLPHRGFALSLEDGAEADGVSGRDRARECDSRGDGGEAGGERGERRTDRAAFWTLSRSGHLSRRDIRPAVGTDRARNPPMSERDLIARIRELFPRAGDDAAVIGNQVITNDVLVENVDFTRAIPLRLIARKSLTINLSDVAAMGGRPRYAIVAIGSAVEEDASAIIEELAIAARENDVEIIGGDL